MLFHRRRNDFPQDNPDRWLLTYADLITLLLAFFVVLYSMSQVDAERFGKISRALHGVLKGGPSILRTQEPLNNPGHGLLRTGDLNMLQQRVQEKTHQIGRQDEVMTELNERGLTIHIMESALFDEGRARLKPRAKSILDLVAINIIQMPNHIRIEGHTDDRPIKNDRFPTNWELSTARSTEVVRYFIDKHNFPPEKLAALGYSSYRPYVPNNNIENRSRNRRVDIIILTMELSAVEPASDINNFARRQINLLLSDRKEIDSLSNWNIFPF